jgi:hypothetical protein
LTGPGESSHLVATAVTSILDLIAAWSSGLGATAHHDG